LDADAAGDDVLLQVARLAEAQVHVPGDVVAEAVRAGAVHGQTILRDGIEGERLALLARLTVAARVRAGESEIDAGLHRTLPPEQLHLLSLGVGTGQAHIHAGVGVGGDRATHLRVLRLGRAVLDPQLAARVVLEIAGDAEQRQPLAARGDVGRGRTVGERGR